MRTRVRVAIVLESAAAAAAVGIAYVSIWITFSLVESITNVLKLL
jgi:hypothetical protein